MKKLAIISTHPIQYNAPFFALLNKSDKLQSKVFYTWSQSQEELFDKDFGKTIKWDIPLLEGYDYEFIENIAKDPGPHHFKGIITPELIPAIEKWGADGILIYGWNFRSHLKAMKYFKNRIPVYFRGDSTLLDERKGLRKIIRRIFLKYVYRNVDYAFYVGKNNKAYFLAHGLKEKNLHFAPHAIDNKRFSDPEGKNKEAALKWRKELQIPEGKVCVIFVGKFEPKKDPMVLLSAAGELTETDLHFIFAGDGLFAEEMYATGKTLNNVSFIPFQNQAKMPEVYKLGDILALPSQGPGETWGLVVNEAMAGGLAILASNKVGCAIDLVKEGENGYVMEAGNVEECIKKLKAFTKDQKYIKMGKRSVEIIKDWSFENIKKSIEEHCFK